MEKILVNATPDQCWVFYKGSRISAVHLETMLTTLRNTGFILITAEPETVPSLLEIVSELRPG